MAVASQYTAAPTSPTSAPASGIAQLARAMSPASIGLP
jgi:hypothetical protein